MLPHHHPVVLCVYSFCSITTSYRDTLGDAVVNLDHFMQPPYPIRNARLAAHM